MIDSQKHKDVYEQVSACLARALEDLMSEYEVESCSVLDEMRRGARVLSRPTDASHGDLATNLPFKLAKEFRRKPLDIAGDLANKFVGPATAKPAAPGFVNFTLDSEFLINQLTRVGGETWGTNTLGEGKRVNLEYVSANPTGPLHVGHGRGAVIGDVAARLLTNAGYDVTREYYLNDEGGQIEALGASLLSSARIQSGEDDGGYERGYKGDYIDELAKTYLEAGMPISKKGDAAVLESASDFASKKLLEDILDDLKKLDITFDHVQSEKAIHPRIESVISRYREKDLLYEADRALGSENKKRRGDSQAALHSEGMEGGTFLRTSKFGDDDDRIILRKDGRSTYFTADIAYHLDKIDRKFDWLIDFWGADHGGHVKRLKAALDALDTKIDFDVLLCQMVKLKRGDEEIKMSKRSGDMITLSEVTEEVGADAVRFFFLMRAHTAQMDFDLQLAVEKSSDNPVYYCQYAYARTRQLLAKGKEFGLEPSSENLDVLTDQTELDIMRSLVQLPEFVRAAASRIEVHRLPEAAMELAGMLHRYQTSGKLNENLRIVRADEPKISSARLYLIGKVGDTMKWILDLMGVSAPERM